MTIHINKHDRGFHLEYLASWQPKISIFLFLLSVVSFGNIGNIGQHYTEFIVVLL